MTASPRKFRTEQASRAGLAAGKAVIAIVAIAAWYGSIENAACADGPQRDNPRYAANGYARTVHRPRAMITRESARALGRIGFRYENGFGVPQNYDVAADYYARAAEGGDTFAQSRLGLSYDRGHGVPQNFVLSYKWLDLAAARAPRSERDFYIKLRNAVAQKMSHEQVTEGQELAIEWAASRY
jgi:TPR repeat protein